MCEVMIPISIRLKLGQCGLDETKINFPKIFLSYTSDFTCVIKVKKTTRTIEGKYLCGVLEWIDGAEYMHDCTHVTCAEHDMHTHTHTHMYI